MPCRLNQPMHQPACPTAKPLCALSGGPISLESPATDQHSAASKPCPSIKFQDLCHQQGTEEAAGSPETVNF